MKLTIAFITARKEPRFDWFLESLATQIIPGDGIQIVLVDFFAQPCDYWQPTDVGLRKFQLDKMIEDCFRLCPPSLWARIETNIVWCPPMPSVWQGPSRITKENWWAKSAALNTALCHAKGEWFLHVDDRCVLSPILMDRVREAMMNSQIMFGAFEKRVAVEVENGLMTAAGHCLRRDERQFLNEPNGIHPVDAAHFCYGCVALGPTEWFLNVNGWDTTCDGLSYEDVIMGHHLLNNGCPMFYDYLMMIVEDRTPGQCEPTFRRDDKGTRPHNKSTAMFDMLTHLKRAKHNLDLREIRNNVLAGQPFPNATEPKIDWWDGQAIKDF